MKQLEWSEPLRKLVRSAEKKLAALDKLRASEFKQGAAHVVPLRASRPAGSLTVCINDTTVKRDAKRAKIEATRHGEGAVSSAWIVEPCSQVGNGMRAAGIYRKRVGKCRSLLVKHNKKSIARNMGDVASDTALLLALLG